MKDWSTNQRLRECSFFTMNYCATSLGTRKIDTFQLFREVGPNLRNWGSDTVDTYIGKPLENGNQ